MSFQTLSLEIRWEIWGFALEEPRNFELRIKDRPFRCVKNAQGGFQIQGRNTTPTIGITRTSIPLVFQICKESRQVGLETYERLVLGHSFEGYFNSEVDKLVIPPELFPSLGYFGYKTQVPPFPAWGHLEELCNIAFYFPVVKNGLPRDPRDALHIFDMVRNLAKLRTITYISDLENPATPEFQRLFQHNWTVAPDVLPGARRRESPCDIIYEQAQRKPYWREICRH